MVLEPVADPAAGARRRVLRSEIWLVLGVSLGASAVYAAVSLIVKLTTGPAGSLASQRAVLNTSLAPGRPWLDLIYQILGIAFDLVPALLAVHLLQRDPGDVRGLLGIDSRRPGFDTVAGGALAAVIGIPGLALYFGARAAGLNATVVPAALPHVWWAIPVLVLAAFQNGLLEEVVVVGYLINRLCGVPGGPRRDRDGVWGDRDQPWGDRDGLPGAPSAETAGGTVSGLGWSGGPLAGVAGGTVSGLGWSVAAAVAASAVLRGSYHLYQGFGGFVGNALMGVVFAMFYLRTRRILPLIVAHTLLDVVAFVGYALVGHRLGLS